MFDNPGNVTLVDCDLIDASTNIHNQLGSKPPIEKLRENFVHGATFDSGERYDPPKCHPETRIELLTEIREWAQEQSSAEKRILWLYGAAGAGKSAIAQTSCERWSEEGCLGASFYFLRSMAERNNNKKFVATIVCQLWESVPGARRYIEDAISADFRIFSKPLKDQVMALIIKTLTAPYTNALPTRKIVVVDGLDECCDDFPTQNHEEQQREILDVIALAVEHHTPLRFLITSRREFEIRTSFEAERLNSMTFLISLDNLSGVKRDIAISLQSSFQEIRSRHKELELDWPGQDVIDVLVDKSSGQFIYASTIVRYVGDRRYDPKARLKHVLGLSLPEVGSTNPLAQLDFLYTLIMDLLQPDSLMGVRKIFSFFISPIRNPFIAVTPNSVDFFARLLFSTEKQIYCYLADLHSILEVPDEKFTTSKPIRLMHASFGEFLSDKSRSGRHHIGPEEVQLHQNISIAKHAIIGIVQACDSKAYNLRALPSMIIEGLKKGCTPSKDLQCALHILFRRKGFEYNENLEDLEIPWAPKKDAMRTMISLKDQLIVIDYLQNCNIKSIVKSPVRRWWMGACLIGQKMSIDNPPFKIFKSGCTFIFLKVSSSLFVPSAAIVTALTWSFEEARTFKRVGPHRRIDCQVKHWQNLVIDSEIDSSPGLLLPMSLLDLILLFGITSTTVVEWCSWTIKWAFVGPLRDLVWALAIVSRDVEGGILRFGITSTASVEWCSWTIRRAFRDSLQDLGMILRDIGWTLIRIVAAGLLITLLLVTSFTTFFTVYIWVKLTLRSLHRAVIWTIEKLDRKVAGGR